MTDALTRLTLGGARDKLEAGEITSLELTEAHIAAMEAVRPLNVMITETPDRALAMAKASDARRAHGRAGGVALARLGVALRLLALQRGRAPDRAPRAPLGLHVVGNAHQELRDGEQVGVEVEVEVGGGHRPGLLRGGRLGLGHAVQAMFHARLAQDRAENQQLVGALVSVEDGD